MEIVKNDMAELIDMRLKVSIKTNQILEAMSRSSGTDKNEIARKVLDEFADGKIHEANLIHRLTKGEGFGAA